MARGVARAEDKQKGKSKVKMQKSKVKSKNAKGKTGSLFRHDREDT
jgi:hypothetical protein